MPRDEVEDRIATLEALGLRDLGFLGFLRFLGFRVLGVLTSNFRV